MRSFAPWALCALLFVVACTDEADTDHTDHDHIDDDHTDDTDEGVEDIAIAGSWVDDFGSTHVISNTAWDSYGAGTPVALSVYDNEDLWAVGQNAPDDAYNPDKWSRFDWYWDDSDQLWYCQTAFSAETEQGALDTAPADTSDPSTGGRGGFAWSQLTPAG